MLNPIEAREIGDFVYRFVSGDGKIVATVQCKLKIKGIMEGDESNDEAEEEREKELMIKKQIIGLCQQMETICIEHGSFGDSLGRAKHLQQYRIHPRHRGQSPDQVQTPDDGTVA